MKKSNLIKIFLVLIVSMIVILSNVTVFAENSTDDEFEDLTGTLGNNTTGNNIVGNNSVGNNIVGNNSVGNNTAGNNSLVNNNSSVYNNVNLPKTGIGDSIPVAVLVVILGISAVYAYKKIKEYRNI